MNNKLANDKKFYQKKLYIKVRELFVNKKYNSLIKEATNYLELFPNDVNVRFMRAKTYRKLEMFDEAINDLKYNLALDDNSHSITELYFIYYHLNKYEEAIELLPDIYSKRCINAYSVSISELVMKLQLGIEIKVKKDAKCDYIRSQIFNYSTTASLSHIQQSHITEIAENTSSFNEGINLDYLFNLIRNNLKIGKKANVDEMLEIYYFGISNIGQFNNESCNFVKVVVIPNTDNIITIYPTNSVDVNYISMIDVDYNKLFNKKEEKVKRLSQIDKFNSRLKRV